MNQLKSIFFCLVTLFLVGCSNSREPNATELPKNEIWVKMLVEIPAGSIEKYELNKTTNEIERDSVSGKPRTINYLGYPANYGMIQETILPYDLGGDGDPLDIVAIGPPAKTGEVLDVKVIGVLKLKDKGEQDDKLIGIVKNSTLIDVNSINQLNKEYQGITKIIETWFSNYKGKKKMKSEGYNNSLEAKKILLQAQKAYISR